MTIDAATAAAFQAYALDAMHTAANTARAARDAATAAANVARKNAAYARAALDNSPAAVKNGGVHYADDLFRNARNAAAHAAAAVTYAALCATDATPQDANAHAAAARRAQVDAEYCRSVTKERMNLIYQVSHYTPTPAQIDAATAALDATLTLA